MTHGFRRSITMNHIEFYNENVSKQPPTKKKGLTDVNDIITSGLPWLSIDLFDNSKTTKNISFMFDRMLAEARILGDCFVPHRTKEANHGWSSLCIHGMSSVHTGMVRGGPVHPHVWTDIAKFCPMTQAFLQDFRYDKFYRVRFMKLAPGGYICPHSDMEEDRLDTINIALNNPSNCHFVMKDVGIVPFKSKSVMLLSLSRDHIVWNQSDEDRYHIIVHGVRNQQFWDETIKKAYDAY